MEGKPGRQPALCQASPERGGRLASGTFVGEVAGVDSLSFATSSPFSTKMHTDTQKVRDSVGLAEQEVRFVPHREVKTVYTTVTSETVFA